MAVGCVTSEYLPASFKGVFFEAMEATSEHGRRGAVGEFPFGENTAYADLGRKASVYTIKARFVQNSHLSDVQSLIRAVESPGSGQLVHPTRGIMRVACRMMKVTDDLLEKQGVSFADLDFVEANDWPASMSLGQGIFGASSVGVSAAAQAVFLRDYNPVRAQYHRRQQVFATASSVISSVRDEYSRINPNSSDIAVIRALADYETILNDDVLLSQNQIVYTAITSGMSAISRQISGEEKFEVMRRIANVAAAGSTIPGSAGLSQEAVYTLTRITAGTYIGQSAVEQRFSSADSAIRYLDVFDAVMIGEAEIAYARCNSELFLQLRQYIVAMETQLYSKAYTLPGIVRYNFSGGVHPLVAAYSIYGDAKLHRDLELGNIISSTGRFANYVVGPGQ